MMKRRKGKKSLRRLPKRIMDWLDGFWAREYEAENRGFINKNRED